MKILFFAHLKDVCGSTEMTLNCDHLNVDGLWGKLIEAHPGLEKFRSSVRIARNWEYVGPEAEFKDSDEIAFIPPVSGG